MKRISISFYDEIYEKLEQRMKKLGSPSVAQSVRELVDMALKIESAAKESNVNTYEDKVIAAINELKKLFKADLNWSLETRLLARFLVDNHESGNGEKRADILEQYKKTATDYVQGLYGEKIE